MGCLKWIIRIIFLVLIYIALQSSGCIDFFKVKLDSFIKNQNIAKISKANNLGNFSNLSSEFKIKHAYSFASYNLVYATHIGSSQKFVVLKYNYKNKLLNVDDFKSGVAEKKINDFLNNTKDCFIHLEDFKVINKGFLVVNNQKIPYIRFNTNIVNIPVKEFEGIICAKRNIYCENILFLSLNDKRKYSQIIAQEFIKSVKND